MPVGIRSTQYKDIDGTTDKFATAMALGHQYIFTANVNCWVLVGATGASAAADTANNILYVAGQQLLLACNDATNGFVHIISDGVSGDGTLSLVEGM